MNLQSTLSVYGGGAGSGCNPDAGKCGRPAGPGKENFYHGTITTSAADILKKGLKPGTIGKKFNISRDDRPSVVLHKGRERGYVYLTTDPRVAKTYAEFRAAYDAAKPGDRVPYGDGIETKRTMFIKTAGKSIPGDKPAIVQLQLPISVAKKLEVDPISSPGSESWRTTGIIPKKYIADVFVKKGSEYESEMDNKIAAEAIVNLYLVYFGDLGLLKRHLNGENV